MNRWQSGATGRTCKAVVRKKRSSKQNPVFPLVGVEHHAKVHERVRTVKGCGKSACLSVCFPLLRLPVLLGHIRLPSTPLGRGPGLRKAIFWKKLLMAVYRYLWIWKILNQRFYSTSRPNLGMTLGPNKRKRRFCLELRFFRITALQVLPVAPLCHRFITCTSNCQLRFQFSIPSRDSKGLHPERPVAKFAEPRKCIQKCEPCRDDHRPNLSDVNGSPWIGR